MCRPLLFLAAGAALASEPPRQPVPFSHQVHAAQHLACAACHTGRGDAMGLPTAGFCMGCHQSVKTKSPAMSELARYAAPGNAIQWVRVYRIDAGIRFSHRKHADAGARCEACHGPVEIRDALWAERDFTSGACMQCHQTDDRAVGCQACHKTQ